MSLQEILFGDFTPPSDCGHRVHRIGFSNGARYIEPKKPKGRAPSTTPNQSEEKVLKILKRQTKPITSSELAPLIGMTQNHCGILLTALFRKGKVSRVKCHKPGTRFFRYTVKEDM